MIRFEGLIKPWVIGVVIILIIVLSDVAIRRAGMGSNSWMLYYVWGMFMVAVFITSYLAPVHKLILGMSHTLTISFLFALSNLIQSNIGMATDMGGKGGFGVVFSLIYVTSFIPALIASVIALVVSSRVGEDLEK